MTPSVPPVAPAGAGAGFTAPPTGDQDWNITAPTTTHDWAEDGGDWGATEPKVRRLSYRTLHHDPIICVGGR